MDVPSPTPASAPEKKPPEKYIRTLASDMDAVQKGGTPSLAPPPAPPPPIPVAKAPSALPTPPSSPVPPTPAPVQNVVSAPSRQAPSSLNILATPKNPPQTYSGDFSQRVKDVHASTATILAAEQDRGVRTPLAAPPESSRTANRIYGIAGTVLIVVSIAGAYSAYRHYTTTSVPVTPVVRSSAPIFVDEREEISGSGVTLLQAVTNSVNHPLAAGTVRLLYTADSSAVFSALPIALPDVLARNITAPRSMAGVINVNGTQSPFFILSVSSYSVVFSGMLSWEPLIPGSLAELFPPYPPPASVTASSTSATTTTKNIPNVATTTAPVPAPSITFVDRTVTSHDVRVYRDASGRDVLLYGFWNQATLVIARDAAAFAEIVTRLATAPAH